MRKIFLLSFAAAFLTACGNYHYEEAEKLRSQGLMLGAAEHYALFAEKSPSDPRAQQALFKAAGIYSKEFSLCSKSGPLFERLLRNYPATPLRSEALRGLFLCPDYFPVNAAGSWLYGDSQTGGKNARYEFSITAVAPDKTTAENCIYAGRQLVIRQKRAYYLSGGDLIEKQGGFDTIILRNPPRLGLSWTSHDRGGRVSFKVEAEGLKIKTRAGEFGNCIKVSRRMAGMPSWIYEYYAPWKGRVLTSVGGPGFEHRVMELISYEEKTK
ncbi:MAG: hypothetical protein A2X34_06155 [Elusimicrobia bacterium GWC2_51_8]|nr:MAG: hypothetical protein A2X33_02985 [Elusimicrobia bacterium GWA2_51_34]OGR59511.1 MAG: hypothetical protein A2X34_06155 [Elusimicrobia bacterium GWC2_51_8]OGR86571.1 MAG: hypothetical protein A2021_06235 [Elusimicrobia bacterium GWF2_52_66]HAF95646.1 hypothetical protein [Elusimicrobiota bacterium]HCE97663.1 hypothetical protein [Elusimicrobiota bacterium]